MLFAMYRKLLQRIKKSYKDVQASVRSLQAPGRQPTEKLKYHDNQEAKSSICEKRIQTTYLKVQDAATSCQSLYSNVSTPNTEDSWKTLLSSHNYKNWLKVGMALRTACNYVSPVVEHIAKIIHCSLLEKYGSHASLHNWERCREKWIKDVFLLHNRPPSKSALSRICNVSEWPTPRGQWEIAKVFMANGFAPGGTSEGASTFDASALFNFLMRCRLVNDFVDNFDYVRGVLKVRNKTMHCPRFEFTDEERDEQFEHILALFQDERLKFHVDQSLDSSALMRDILDIKTADLTINATARSTLEIIDGRILESHESGLNPSAKTTSLESLKKVASKILSPPYAQDEAKMVQIPGHPNKRLKTLDSILNVQKLLATGAKVPFRNKSETTISSLVNSGIWSHIYQAYHFAFNSDKTTLYRQFHSGPNSSVTTNKRKHENDDENQPSGSKPKRRRVDEDTAECGSERKKGEGGSGGGGNYSLYEEMLNNFLMSQTKNKGASYIHEKDKHGKFLASVDFVSNFAIMGKYPKETIRDAEREAAATALQNLGIKVYNKAEAKDLFDTYCKAVPKKLPTYKTYEVSTSPHFTILQIFNNSTIYFIEALATDKIFVQAKCRLTESNEDDAEIIVAKMVLEEARIDTGKLEDIKGAFTEYCLKNGGTLPIYNNKDGFDIKTNEKYQESTATSFIRNCLTDRAASPEELADLEVDSEVDFYTSDLHYADLFETTSVLPQRSRRKSEEAASRNALEKYGFDISQCEGRNFKSTLNDYCQQWDFSLAYHTFQVKPLVRYAKQYECVVASPALRESNQEFSVACDPIGFSTAGEARESAARNSLALLGQHT